eukprot:COSAG05_NODE_264_length_12674_cov_6.768111_10_plen_142_part_00
MLRPRDLDQRRWVRFCDKGCVRGLSRSQWHCWIVRAVEVKIWDLTTFHVPELPREEETAEADACGEVAGIAGITAVTCSVAQSRILLLRNVDKSKSIQGSSQHITEVVVIPSPSPRMAVNQATIMPPALLPKVTMWSVLIL